MKHAEKLIDRILFLEGVPEIARYDVIRVGTDVKEQFENDLELEMGGVNAYNEMVDLCIQVKDNGTRELIEPILVESEEHVDWLETQLGLIAGGRPAELPDRADGRRRGRGVDRQVLPDLAVAAGAAVAGPGDGAEVAEGAGVVGANGHDDASSVTFRQRQTMRSGQLPTAGHAEQLPAQSVVRSSSVMANRCLAEIESQSILKRHPARCQDGRSRDRQGAA